jgi:hypothetical protein
MIDNISLWSDYILNKQTNNKIKIKRIVLLLLIILLLFLKIELAELHPSVVQQLITCVVPIESIKVPGLQVFEQLLTVEYVYPFLSIDFCFYL